MVVKPNDIMVDIVRPKDTTKVDIVKPNDTVVGVG